LSSLGLLNFTTPVLFPDGPNTPSDAKRPLELLSDGLAAGLTVVAAIGIVVSVAVANDSGTYRRSMRPGADLVRAFSWPS